jgi:hypothetical protein
MAEKDDMANRSSPVYETPLHRVEALSDKLVLSRKFPPAKRFIVYQDIASVEHTRLIDYRLLINLAIPLFLIYLINYVDVARDIIARLVLEIGHAAGHFTSTVVDQQVLWETQNAISLLTAVLILAVGYYTIRFAMSLGMRLVVYQVGKSPIAIPLRLTGDSMKVLSEINTRSKEAKGISKEEAQKIIGDQIRELLDSRVKMQEQMLNSLKIAALAANTPQAKSKLKQMMDESIAKLEAEDEAIDRELRKTGLKKEDVFKKYRIKAPKEEFIDSVLKDGDLSSLLSDK